MTSGKSQPLTVLDILECCCSRFLAWPINKASAGMLGCKWQPMWVILTSRHHNVRYKCEHQNPGSPSHRHHETWSYLQVDGSTWGWGWWSGKWFQVACEYSSIHLPVWHGNPFRSNPFKFLENERLLWEPKLGSRWLQLLSCTSKTASTVGFHARHMAVAHANSFVAPSTWAAWTLKLLGSHWPVYILELNPISMIESNCWTIIESNWIFDLSLKMCFWTSLHARDKALPWNCFFFYQAICGRSWATRQQQPF